MRALFSSDPSSSTDDLDILLEATAVKVLEILEDKILKGRQDKSQDKDKSKHAVLLEFTLAFPRHHGRQVNIFIWWNALRGCTGNTRQVL